MNMFNIFLPVSNRIFLIIQTIKTRAETVVNLWTSFMTTLLPPQTLSRFLTLSGQSGERINLSDYLLLRGGETVADHYAEPTDIVNLIVANLFVVAGIILFGLIIMAGFKYLQGTSEGKEEAKNLITGAVIGFLVMFAAYWIVQIIQFVTGADIPI